MRSKTKTVGFLASGPKTIAELRAAATANGHSWASFRRAKRPAGLDTRWAGKAWVWYILGCDAAIQVAQREDSFPRLQNLSHLSALNYPRNGKTLAANKNQPAQVVQIFQPRAIGEIPAEVKVEV
jgi:hypothetical protein